MLEAVVLVLGVIVWLATEGWFPGMPVVRGRQPNLRLAPNPVRFSLRALLITVTLVAVVLGLAAYAVRYSAQLNVKKRAMERREEAKKLFMADPAK